MKVNNKYHDLIWEYLIEVGCAEGRMHIKKNEEIKKEIKEGADLKDFIEDRKICISSPEDALNDAVVFVSLLQKRKNIIYSKLSENIKSKAASYAKKLEAFEKEVLGDELFSLIFYSTYFSIDKVDTLEKALLMIKLKEKNQSLINALKVINKGFNIPSYRQKDILRHTLISRFCRYYIEVAAKNINQVVLMANSIAFINILISFINTKLGDQIKLISDNAENSKSVDLKLIRKEIKKHKISSPFGT